MGKHWFAVHTKVGGEKRAEAGLRELGFEAYLPMATRWARHARRRTRVHRPLLPRYLFVGLDGPMPVFYTVLQVDGVESFVGISGKPVEIAYAAIDPIRMAEIRGDFDLTREHELVRYSKGARVKIVGGIFTGFMGEFQKAVGEKRAKVLLKELGRVIGSGPVEVGVAQLEAVSDAA